MNKKLVAAVKHMSAELQPPELSEAIREIEALRRQLQDRGAFGDLVGTSAPMREIYSRWSSRLLRLPRQY